MPDWPHAPPHRTLSPGCYFVTGATYGKEHYFRTKERLNNLQDALLGSLRDAGWNVQAWSVFSNHYHVIASSLSPENLGETLQACYSRTAISVNRLDGTPDRKVWFQFRDTFLSYEKSYFARLNYVLQNPVKHGLVRNAADYPWCYAAWFERVCPRSFVETVKRFKTDRVNIADDFDPVVDW